MFRGWSWLLTRFEPLALPLDADVEDPLLITSNEIVEPIETTVLFNQSATYVNSLLALGWAEIMWSPLTGSRYQTQLSKMMMYIWLGTSKPACQLALS